MHPKPPRSTVLAPVDVLAAVALSVPGGGDVNATKTDGIRGFKIAVTRLDGTNGDRE